MMNIQNLEGMIKHAAQHPHLQSVLTEKLHSHLKSSLESVDATTITPDHFYDLFVAPIITLKESLPANDKHLQNALSELAPYAPSIVYFFEQASSLSGVDVKEGTWSDMSSHVEMCSAMFKVLDALDETNVEGMNRVISCHFNQFAKLDPTSYGYSRDLLTSFDDLMHDIHVYTNLPKELEHTLIAELFKAINRVDVDTFSARTSVEHHLQFYGIASNGTVWPQLTPYSDANATLDILKASIDFSGNDIDDHEIFTSTLCEILEKSTQEAADSFIDHLVDSTWNTTNSKMQDDVELLQILLSHPSTSFSLSQDQSERILSKIEHVMSTSQKYGYEDVSSDATTDDLVRVFKSRIEFLNTFITQGSDPEMDERVLEIMNREHAIAFRDGLLDITFDPAWSKDENWSGFLADIQSTLDVIKNANESVNMTGDISDDPLAQASNDKQQSLQ